MKKFLVSVMAAFMVFAIAGPAAAYFETLDAMLSIYHYEEATQTSGEVIGKEVGLDLNDLWAQTAQGTGNIKNVPLAATFSKADFGLGATDSMSKLKAGISSGKLNGYVEWSLNGNYPAVYSSNSVYSTYKSVRDFYGEKDINGKIIIGSATDARSFYTKLGSSYANSNLDFGSNGVASLVDNGSVDLYLYHFDSLITGMTLNTGSVYGLDTPYYAVVRLTSDASGNVSVMLNPDMAPAVPVPGALLLLGSGLLGLVGIRRRK